MTIQERIDLLELQLKSAQESEQKFWDLYDQTGEQEYESLAQEKSFECDDILEDLDYLKEGLMQQEKYTKLMNDAMSSMTNTRFNAACEKYFSGKQK